MSNLVRSLLNGTAEVQRLIKTKSYYTEEQRRTYLSRASLYNVTERTLTVMLAQLFSGEFEVSNSNIVNVNHHQSIRDFIEEIAEEILIAGRIGVLVDPRPDSKAILKIFKSEQILSTRTDRDGVLKRALLQEIVDIADEDDDYQELATRDIRLHIVNGKYCISTGGQTIEVLVQGKPIDYIPFFVISYKGLAYTQSKPPLLALAEMNVQHYKKQLALSHALELVASPTTILIGRNIAPNQSATLSLGPEEVIDLPNGADAKFLELNADSISFLMKEIENIETRMAFLGTQLLDSDRISGQSGLAIDVAHSGEKSVLSSLSYTISEGASRFLTVMNNFMGASDEVKVSVKLKSACALVLNHQTSKQELENQMKQETEKNVTKSNSLN